jgi:hypothetical protein
MTGPGLRPDFARAAARLAGPDWLAAASPEQTRQLLRLQKASEDFEAMFVKGLMDVAKRTTLGEEPSAVADFAHDMMHAAVAEAVSRRQPGLGISISVFREAARALAAQAPLDPTKEQP